jgi:uncharacterized protein YecT (DUF1311 family)
MIVWGQRMHLRLLLRLLCCFCCMGIALTQSCRAKWEEGQSDKTTLRLSCRPKRAEERSDPTLKRSHLASFVAPYARGALMRYGLPLLPRGAAVAVQDSPVFRNFIDLLGDHPLDQAFRECNAGNNPGDYGERNCIAAFLEKWEVELALTYKLLYEYCSPGPSGKKIKAAQRQWEKFRKAEFAFIEGQYEGVDGTMYEWFVSQQKLTLVRERAIVLGNYYLRLKADRD